MLIQKAKINFKILVSIMAVIMIINLFSACKSVGGSKMIIKVDDFGAVPNDATDDGDAIRSAIDAAIKIGPGTSVVFSKGQYMAKKASATYSGGESYAFLYKDIDGIELKGNNTEIILGDNFMGAFAFINCSNITVEGFIIDYEKPPWVQGEVAAIDAEAGTFDFVAEEGYDLLDDPRWQQVLAKTDTYFGTHVFGMIMDKDNPHLLKKTAPDNFKGFDSLVKTGELTYRIGLKDTYKSYIGSHIEAGDKIVINNRWGSLAAFRIPLCSNITIKKCTVYASAGGTVIGSYINGYLKIDNLKVIRKPDSERWITTNSDGVHIQFMNGHVELTNSIFEGLSDDCVNLYSTAMSLDKVISPTQIVVTGKGAPVVGETIEIFDPIKGNIKGSAKVINTTIVKDTTYINSDRTVILTLEEPIQDMIAGSDRFTGDTVYNVNGAFSGTVIANNIFRESRRYGIFLKTHNTVVKNNTFQSLGSIALAVYNIPSIPEGLTVDGLEISNNIIESSPYLYYNGRVSYSAGILIRGVKLPSGLSEGQIQRNIVIKNNNIKYTSRNGIYISCAENVRLLSNIISCEDDTVVYDMNSKMGLTGLKLENVKDVNVEGLKITDQREKLSAGIFITEDSSNVELLAKTFKFKLIDAIAEIIDNQRKTEGIE